MIALAPGIAVEVELSRHDFVRVQILRDVQIVTRGELYRGVAVNGGPDWRVRLLEGLWLGKRLIKVKILTVVRHLVLSPGHLDYFQDLLAHRRALIVVQAM